MLKLQKIFVTTFLGVFFGFGGTSANASIYYTQFDYCSAYYDNCETRVIKCRDSGSRFCEASIQLPCAEACESTLG